MNLLMIIPGIFELLEKIIGPLLSGTKSSILASVLGSDGTSGGIMGAIQSVLGNIENEKLAAIQGEINSLLAQSQTNNIEAQRECVYDRGWRPFLAWGLALIILFHLASDEAYNIYCMFHGMALTPLNTLTVTLMFGLLGIYMSARTIEKVSGNQ